jgi:hypothetical protein
MISKYQKPPMIGNRSHQISTDPTKPCIVPIGDMTDSMAMAEKEYECAKIPQIIHRIKGLPGSETAESEYWVLDSDQHVYKDTWTIDPPAIGANAQPLPGDDWSDAPADPTVPIAPKAPMASQQK